MPDRFFLSPWRPATAIGYTAAVVVLCVILAIVGFRITDTTNSNEEHFDQSAYSHMARQMKSSWYPWYSDGVRNPLFPWIAARLHDPEASGFFEAGKKLNVLMGVLGTGLLGIFFARRLGPLAAWNATTLSALAVLLPISTFFGAEAVFYVLFLFVCACAIRLLNTNPVWLYVLLGLLSGLAWLAKPSATPFLALFAGFTVVRLILTRFSNLPWYLKTPDWSLRRLFIGAVLCGLLYGALITPRLLHAQRTWGSATYSLPSFWFWMDDWETCVKKYTDCRKVTLAQLPPEEQPTLSGYFRRHTVSDAIQRAWTGGLVRIGQFFHPEGKWVVEKKGKPRRIVLPQRGLYILGFGALALVMAGLAFRKGHLSKAGPIALPLLLWTATFAVYVLAMGWYLPTGPGHRFIMTLYLPTLWILAQGAEQLRLAANTRMANLLYLGAHGVLAGLMGWRLICLIIGEPFEKISYAF